MTWSELFLFSALLFTTKVQNVVVNSGADFSLTLRGRGLGGEVDVQISPCDHGVFGDNNIKVRDRCYSSA